MRRALAGVTVAVVAAAVAALGWTLWGAPGGVDSRLVARTADAGGVAVTVTPLQLDSQRAVFDVRMDTHTVDLDAGAAATATLSVGPAEWGPVRWVGDGADGHHLAGQLVFAARGPSGGAVRLTIGGLPSPATFEWDVGEI